jgi:hypothetical protein
VLTGQPFKAKRKKATVRFMFRHPDDVRWFRCWVLVYCRCSAVTRCAGL